MLAAAITSLAKSQQSEQPIVLQTQDLSSNITGAVFPELDWATKISTTVSTLMDVEQKIMQTMESIPSSYDDMERNRMRCSLQARLDKVQKMIEEAMSKN